MTVRITSTAVLALVGLLGCQDDGGPPASGTTGTSGASTSAADTSAASSSTSNDADDTGTTGAADSTGSTGEPPPPPGFDPDEPPPMLLSEFNLLQWDGSQITYAEGVHPYDMNLSLFSDFALKDRAIFVPPGEAAAYPAAVYPDNAVFEFPVGTLLVKSFMFPADMTQPELDIDLIETRVLAHYPDGWRNLPYVWDHELGDAVLTVQGATLEITFIDPEGIERTSNYLVPQKNQCAECHEIKDDRDETVLTPIGPTGRNLNRIGRNGANQLEHLVDAGVLEGVPPLAEIPPAWDDRTFEDVPVESLDPETIVLAARDYLDVNCAHCHRPNGVSGISSQLFLNWDNTDEFNLGVCKKPGSAGHSGGLEYDIVPGDAESSILVYRTETLMVGSMMPLLGRSLVDEDGIALLRAWIDAMPANDCVE